MATLALTLHQRQYWAWLLQRRAASDSVESFASTLVDAQVDLNPHQVEAALFVSQNPLAKGVILADEVGLGKTIEAGLMIWQRWAERRRRILIIAPANLRKQWHQELLDKFGVEPLILESKNCNAARKQGQAQPFEGATPVICSYPFACAKADDIRRIAWDLVVLDEAHRVRNVYKPSNVIGRTLRDALAGVHSKVLLTATPLQNSLLELYGLVSFIDDRVFGNLESFRTQFGQLGKSQTFEALRARLAPLCKRTLRRDVQQFVSYTQRRALVQDFTPSDGAFDLRRAPAQDVGAVPLGRYERPRRSGEAHVYRLSHPLAQWVLAQAAGRTLTPARLRFDYAAHGVPVSTLKPLRGKSGLLMVRLLTVAALGGHEQHLVVAAVTDDGHALAEDDAEKLLRLPATEDAPGLFTTAPKALLDDAETRSQAVLRTARERQLRYFEQEVGKLDAWADDLKLGIEQRIKDIDREIKEVRRSATVSPTLDEKLLWQKRQRELEAKRSQLRRELFGQQDEIEARRSAIIEGLERQLEQQVEDCTLFTVEWELV